MKKVLLLVPDDVLSGEMRESFLDRSSFTVRTAGDANEALAMAGVWRPSLVLFKSDLGGMRVVEFCQAIKKHSQESDIKLLMLTELVGAEQQDVDQTGYDAHLISPVDPRQLLHTIATLVDVRERRAPRVHLEVLVRTEGFQESPEPEQDALSNSINISENGILLESNCAFRVGSRGRLSFFLPGSTERIGVSGVVRTVMDEIRLHYAIEFIELQNHHRELIRAYVKEILG